MSEKKKLDEKTLEEVSGGSIESEFNTFKLVNCFECGHYINHTCPYGSPFDAMADAIQVYGKSKCPKKVAIK